MSSSGAVTRVIGTLVHLMAAANFGVAIFKQLTRNPVPKASNISRYCVADF